MSLFIIFKIFYIIKRSSKKPQNKTTFANKKMILQNMLILYPQENSFYSTSFWNNYCQCSFVLIDFFVLENLISIAMTSLSGMVHVHGTILTVILKKLDKVVSMDECTLHAVVLYYPKLLSILILKYAFVLFRFWFLRISFVLLYFVLFPFNFILKFYLFLTMAFFSKFFFSGLFIFFYRLLIIAENWSRVICRALSVVFTVHTYYISTI